MTFSIAEWQDKAREKYETLTQWLGRQRTGVGFMAYGALTTFTIWPLVEAVSAAGQSGQPLPVATILALGSVAGGVGGNLLASQIQNWYENATRGETPTEDDVLQWLTENALQKQELQTAVDQMLENLEAIPQAEAALAQTEWSNFAQELLADLQQLGQSPRAVAQLEGRGVIVQGNRNKVAAFGSAIVEGNVGGDLVIGVKTTQVVDPRQVEPQALRRAYLSRLFDSHNRLLLGGIDPKGATSATAGSQRLQLSAVYTALLTESSEKEHLQDGRLERAIMAQGEQKPRQLAALEKLNTQKELVLLGDPGSGKSTFVSFVTLCLAGEALNDPTRNLRLLTAPLPADEDEEPKRGEKEEEPQPQPWEHGALLPVCIVLRDFAARGLPQAGTPATAEHLWRFISAELQAASLGEYAPLLKKELLETGGIFLFDGLDEVPAAEAHRLQIKQVVEDIAHTYEKCRVLVTSRTYAYQEQAWRLAGFDETVLAPFSKGQIGRFIERWYAHVADVRHVDGQESQGRAALLKQAVFSSRRLYDLAERPLLLTLMASLHAWRGGSLPEKREELYADAVGLLLDTWEQQRIVHDADGRVRNSQPGLEQWLKVDRDRVRGLLNRLAYEAHASQAGLVGTADIAESDLVMGLLRLSDDKSLEPAQLVAYISDRAGLLLPRGVGVYTFPHRTFQEYLAACYLTDAGYPEQVAELARSKPNRWREVALLAGAKATRGSAYALWGLVQELCHKDPGEGDEADYWGAHLAGQFLLETAVLTDLTAAQRQQVERVRQWLVKVLVNPVLPATERALGGRHLAQLGDPRPEVTAVDGMQFCYVPGGDFWLGEGDEAGQVSFLNYDYWLARYPVTQAQYMAFVEDGGYADGQWWPEAAAAGRWKDGAYTWPNPRTAPYDWGPQFRLANLPVVGVSWYETLAYTRWLTARWGKKGWLPEKWQVTLPSEAEWEKGARGGLQIAAQPVVRSLSEIVDLSNLEVARRDNPGPRRSYTWLQGEITAELANYGDSEINQTSSAGCYGAAVSVYGCEEMLGNVWEWTRSLKKDYPYDPDDGREALHRRDWDWTIVRGGSWGSNDNWQRCSARHRGIPDITDDYGGFRVVLSPFFDSGL